MLTLDPQLANLISCSTFCRNLDNGMGESSQVGKEVFRAPIFSLSGSNRLLPQ